jgi:hypothetical protein
MGDEWLDILAGSAEARFADGRVLREIRAVLRDDGVFLMVDPAAASRLEDNLADPAAPFMYAMSLFHCMHLSLAQ